MSFLAGVKSKRLLGSRVHGTRQILRELRRLLGKVERTYHARAGTDDEKRWCCALADSLEGAIAAGDLVLPESHDPRPSRRARKRPV
jgi:hypothetical protein